jgi:hypothetical protein
MVPGRSLREKALTYGILGGTPRFLAAIRPGEDLGMRVAETVLSPRGRRSIEIDVVAELADGRILTGEVKWSSSPVRPHVHSQLLRNLDYLASSGQGWAKDALKPETSAGHLYLSAAGFSPQFKALARADERIVLLDLENLYSL